MYLQAVSDSYSKYSSRLREHMIAYLNSLYTSFKIEPKDIPLYSQRGLVGTIKFTKYNHSLLAGKAYKESEDSPEILLAFERNIPTGKTDLADVKDPITTAIIGGSMEEPIVLMP